MNIPCGWCRYPYPHFPRMRTKRSVMNTFAWFDASLLVGLNMKLQTRNVRRESSEFFQRTQEDSKLFTYGSDSKHAQGVKPSNYSSFHAQCGDCIIIFTSWAFLSIMASSREIIGGHCEVDGTERRNVRKWVLEVPLISIWVSWSVSVKEIQAFLQFQYRQI